MASIHRFPSTQFAETPVVPIRTSPSAEEAAMTRPRYGMQLVQRTAKAERVAKTAVAVAREGFSLEMTSQICSVVARIDLEIGREAGRARLRRLFPAAGSHDGWPLGAA